MNSGFKFVVALFAIYCGVRGGSAYRGKLSWRSGVIVQSMDDNTSSKQELAENQSQVVVVDEVTDADAKEEGAVAQEVKKDDIALGADQKVGVAPCGQYWSEDGKHIVTIKEPISMYEVRVDIYGNTSEEHQRETFSYTAEKETKDGTTTHTLTGVPVGNDMNITGIKVTGNKVELMIGSDTYHLHMAQGSHGCKNVSSKFSLAIPFVVTMCALAWLFCF